jgi:hypothetical protein
MDRFDHFASAGYVILPNVLAQSEIEQAQQRCAEALRTHHADDSVLAGRAGLAYGARNILRLWPDVVELVRARGLIGPLRRILGPDGGLVRGLYFDKPPGRSWALPWHRDMTVAVKEHGRLGVFNKPTRKAGVPHVEAPAELLAGMVTARIHLDAMTPHNGPLSVIPGSHDLANSADRDGIALNCEAGDVLLMRPLLLHASAHCDADHPQHRRVVHLEFTPTRELADGYAWHDFIALDAV